MRKLKRSRKVSKSDLLPRTLSDASSSGSNNPSIFDKERKASGLRLDEIVHRPARKKNKGPAGKKNKGPSCTKRKGLMQIEHESSSDARGWRYDRPWDRADCIKVTCDTTEFSNMTYEES